MNFPQPLQPEPARVPVHVCFSGALECSGCNPCPECRDVVKSAVLPPALAASGLGELTTVLFDLLYALHQRGVDPQQLGVTVPPALRGTQEMAVAYFQGYERGWNSLHARMQQGDLAGRYAATPIAPPPPPAPFPHGPAEMLTEEQIRAIGMASGAPQAPPAAFQGLYHGVVPLHVDDGVVPLSVDPPSYQQQANGPQGYVPVQAPPPVSRTAETVPAAPGSAPRAAPIEPAAAKPPPVRPMQAEEIARMIATPAARPIDPALLQNGVHARGEPVG